MIDWIKNKLKNAAAYLLALFILNDLINGYKKFKEKND